MSDNKNVLVIVENLRLRALLHLSLEYTFPFNIESVGNINDATELLEDAEDGFALVVIDYAIGENSRRAIYNQALESYSESKFIIIAENPDLIEDKESLVTDELIPYSEILAPLNNRIKKHFPSKKKNNPHEFIGITLHVLMMFSELPVDVFIRLNANKTLKILCAGDQTGTVDSERYEERGVEKLFIERRYAQWILSTCNLEISQILNREPIIVDHRGVVVLSSGLTGGPQIGEARRNSNTQDMSVSKRKRKKKKRKKRGESIQKKGPLGNMMDGRDQTDNIDQSVSVAIPSPQEIDSNVQTSSESKQDSDKGSDLHFLDGPEKEDLSSESGNDHAMEQGNIAGEALLLAGSGGIGLNEGPLMLGVSSHQESSEESAASDLMLRVQEIRALSGKGEEEFSIFLDLPYLKTVINKHLPKLSGSDKIASMIVASALKDEEGRKRAQLKKQMLNKPPLGRLIKQAQLQRTDETFFEERVTLTRNIACSLAHLLEWASEVSIEKLLYIAHFHDILLINNPKLARIQTLGEMEQRAAEFTKDEQMLFHDHPQLVSEIIANDPTSTSDVENIVLQHHELPNKAGFPGAIGTAHIVPFAALINVSTDFAQFILKDANWQIEAYLKEARQRSLRGGIFTKIMQALQFSSKSLR
jgi:hypothetical protein